MPVYVCLRENTCVLVISITDFFSFLKIFFLLEDNCFTTLPWFLPYINMNHPYG